MFIENKKITVSGVVAIAMALMMSGVAINGMAASGDFNKALAREYKALAAGEAYENDRPDTRYFEERAARAAAGNMVEPQNVSERKLPEADVAMANDMRNRLVAALKKSQDSKPTLAARAQASFDCWLQELEEDFQPRDIAACQQALHLSLRHLEASDKKTVAVPTMEPSAQARSVAQSLPAVPDSLVVYFDLEASDLNPADKASIRRAAEAAQAAAVKQIDVAGHTDRSGSDSYNLGLSDKRAKAVAAYFKEVMDGAIDVKSAGFGETKPAVATADGVKERRNRRAEASFSR